MTEQWVPWLGGMGITGIVVAVLVGFTMFLILPWWAIIDCARSHRSGNVKAFVIVVLVFTWGLGSTIYGLFVTGSRALRGFTAIAVVVPALTLVVGIVSLGTGVRISAEAQQDRDRAEADRLIAEFRPRALPADAIEPFPAIHFLHDRMGPRAATLARFTIEGPISSTAKDIDRTVRHVARDPVHDRYFALTDHDFGTITPSTGRFTRIEVDPSVGAFSWPKGIAFDTKEDKVVIMTSHVYTRFIKYDPRTSDWERSPAELRDVKVIGLAYSLDEDCLYALQDVPGEPALRYLQRFSTSGATLEPITLDPAIPLGLHHKRMFQLQVNSGKVVVLLPPFGEEDLEAAEAADGAPVDRGNRIFVIDPTTGAVFANPDHAESADAATSEAA